MLSCYQFMKHKIIFITKIYSLSRKVIFTDLTRGAFPKSNYMVASSVVTNRVQWK